MSARRVLLSALLIALLPLPVVAPAQEIGAVLTDGRLVFWDAMERGILQAGADLGVRVSVRRAIDNDPQSVEQNPQLKIAQSMIRAGAKTMILAPMPVRGLATPVEFTVPLVFVDRPSDDFKALSTIATDNYAAGRAAAFSLQGQLPKGAKVGVLRLLPNIASTTDRENGFVEAAKEMGFDVVLDAYVGRGIREAQASVTALLGSYQGLIDAVFTPNEETTFGALRALHKWPREKRPRLVGFDYRAAFKEDLRKGNLYAIVVQDPFQMGYRAVQALVQFRSGQQLPEQVAIDVLVVTANNVDDPTIHTALSHYGD
jgi:ribose transport system substrate-binding protein